MSYLPILAFWFLGIVWGSNFIFMKMASETLAPEQIVFFRVLFGFLPVLLYAYLKGAFSLQHISRARHFLMMALLATAIYYFGFAKGTSLLPSGVAGALSGAIPLFTFAFAAVFLAQEKVTPYKVAGVLSGLIGVAMISGPFRGDLAQTNLEGALFMVLGCVSIGASFVYAKKFLSAVNIAPAALTTYQLGAALLIMTVLTDFDGINRIWTDGPASLALVLGLGLLGTGAAYIAYYYILENLGATSASSVTYIPPLVALLIGALVVGEDIGLSDYFGTGMIFAGVFLLNRGRTVKVKTS